MRKKVNTTLNLTYIFWSECLYRNKFFTVFVIGVLPSRVKVDYHGYEINKDEVPGWIVFPWEDWDK